MRQEKQRLLTLYAQLEAQREATETHAKMLANKIWRDFIEMGNISEEMEDSEEE